MTIGLLTIILGTILSSNSPTVFEAIISNAKGQERDQFFEASAIPTMTENVIYVPLKDATQPWPDPLTSGSFRYQGGVLTLSYSAIPRSNAGSNGRQPMTHSNEIAVWSDVKSVGSGTGSNAFGASTRIETFERNTVKIRFAEGRDRPAGIFRRAEITMAAAAARSLAATAALQITLENPADFSGKADCETAVRPARLDRPREVRDTICTIPVRVSSIRLVRRDTGEEIPTVAMY